MSSQDSSEHEYVIHAKLENVKNFASLLKCIHFKEHAVCIGSKQGLKFIVEDSKCVQAAAFVGKDIFREFHINEDLLSFKIELNVLMECLAIMDGDASMNLYYRGYGFPMRLVIVEDDVVTDCSLKTMEAAETLDFSMPCEDVINKMILDGPQFKDVLSDLDSDSEYIEFHISPDPPYFVVTTISTACKCEVALPKSAEMIEDFTSTSTSITRYKYTQIKPTLKTLQTAAKLCIQMSREGLLCFQFMVKTENDQIAYIEYFCTPVLSEDDD